MLRSSFLKELLVCLLILLFTHTALQKLAEPWPFAFALRQIPFLQKATGMLVWLIPVLELVTAGLLVFPLLRPTGFVLSFLLMAAFSSYVSAMLLFSSHLPCSCGGVLQQLNWPQHLVLNLLLMLGSYWGWRSSFKKQYTNARSFQPN